MRARRAGLGFTLIELLLVIGIILIFLGISIGAVMRTPRVNALLGTEQLVADLVRQARHTARSSGAPVTIEISKSEREVRGVSQLPLWTQSFERTRLASDPPDPDAILADNSTDSVQGTGLSGKGLITDNRTGTPVALAPILLDRQHRLVRTTASGRTEGFYLSCAIRPRTPSDVEPLIMIGGDHEDACSCGLRLERVQRTIQDQQQYRASVGGTTPAPATYACWKIVGWVVAGGSQTVIDSVKDSLSQVILSGSQASGSTPWAVTVDRSALQTTAADKDDVADPIPGGRWEEVGLLYDGQRLELYHNRVLVAVKDFSGTLDLGDSQVHLGHGFFPIALSAQPPPQEKFLEGTLDEARLMRLGVDRAGLLPSGVSAAADYRITVRPDGRIDLQTMSAVDVQAPPVGGPGTAPAVTPNVLSFLLPNSGGANGDIAEVTVYPDGRVTSRVVTP